MLHRLLNKQDVVGLEITDDFIRIAFLVTKKQKPDAPTLIEVPLAQNIIVNGVIQDQIELTKIITSVLNKYNNIPRYAVLSLPAQIIYSHVLYLPQSVNEQKIREAVSVFTRFQLPFSALSAYIGHEISSLPNKQKAILITAAARSTIDGYLAVLGKAGVKLIAAEPSALSITRATSPTPESVLLKQEFSTRTEYAIMCDGYIRHSSVTAKNNEDKKKKKGDDKEIDRLKEFYESETNLHVTTVVTTAELVPNQAVAAFFPQQKPDPQWFASLGGALRGLTPRALDTGTSVLPLGAAEAYLYQKVTTYAEVLAGLTIGILTVMCFFFGGVLFFTSSLKQQIISSAASSLSPATTPDYKAAEQRVRDINTLTTASHTFLNSSLRNTSIVSRLTQIIPPTITVNILSITSDKDPVLITGIATDRPALNAFRETLDGIAYIYDVQMPLNNLNKKETVPFTITLRINRDKLNASL